MDSKEQEEPGSGGNGSFRHCRHRRGRGDWVSPRVGNYSKPRVLKERSDKALEEEIIYFTAFSETKKAFSLKT